MSFTATLGGWVSWVTTMPTSDWMTSLSAIQLNSSLGRLPAAATTRAASYLWVKVQKIIRIFTIEYYHVWHISLYYTSGWQSEIIGWKPACIEGVYSMIGRRSTISCTCIYIHWLLCLYQVICCTYLAVKTFVIGHVIYCADVYTMYCLMAVVTIVVCHLCMQTFVLKGDAPHSHWKEQKEQASTLWVICSGMCPHWSVVVGPTTTQPLLITTQASFAPPSDSPEHKCWNAAILYCFY